MEVGRSFEEARSAEETLMSVPKMENAKCRATMEASEKGQMMAELEGSKQKSCHNENDDGVIRYRVQLLVSDGSENSECLFSLL
ncbi:hypothetical protein F2Q68_00010281 [Brassica cretica]|uniref:Uncharacterized protein n=1 Tax=Brassica cretica TaxID=69181 RepID=A0A8S9KXQ2_BRACR|nr:hypothetical protein F2Q68_00010281 [Brassica cretica]